MELKLPYITGDLPGIGGALKREPSHFVVEELPLYEPAGEGEHVYVNLTREGWTTHALRKRLANLFGHRPRDVGFAGLKDKHARATQTFSLPLLSLDEDQVARRIAQALPVEVHWVCRHRNKLRRGHLSGNHFHILLWGPEPGVEGALLRAREIARALGERGLPNYYGPQRFGRRGMNAVRGREVLRGFREERRRWLRRLYLSAYQSELFNRWLAKRIERGWFRRLFGGDVAQVIASGGLFTVEDEKRERLRFERREITYTGPIYGSQMWWAGGRPGELEREIYQQEGLSPEEFKRAGLKGSRRRARLLPDDLRIEPREGALLFRFTLPKGAYATTLLREVTKRDVDARS